jgi:hypothetical protein
MGSMSHGYKVDLSALDEVIKKLNNIVDDMDGSKNKAKYETNIPAHWLGVNFVEATELHSAHDETKGNIEAFIDQLQQLIVKYSSDTAQVRRNYDDQEQRTSHAVSTGTDLG